MKKYFIIAALFCVCLLTACKKEVVQLPSFDIALKSLTYKVGDTVNFSFTGNADFLTFYSGEKGHEYQHRARTLLTGGTVELSFSSMVQFASQPDNLKVLASTDFKGDYSPAGITAATWTDLTPGFTLATSTTFVPSGKKSVSSLLQTGKPVYIAFKFIGQASATASQRTWRVSSFLLSSTFPDGSVNTLATQANAGWTFVDVANASNTWAFTGTDIIFKPNATLAYSEDWAVTGAFNPDKTSPDVGVPIKNYSNNTMSSYSYIYKVPGVYKIGFTAINSEVSGEQKLLKEVQITVVP